MDKLLKLEITSPDRIMYSGSVKYVIAPAKKGEIQILFNHADLVSILGTGRIVIEEESGNIIKYAASGGIIEIKKNAISILAEEIQRWDEIDIENAKEKIAKANEELKTIGTDKESLFVLLQTEKNKINVAKS